MSNKYGRKILGKSMDAGKDFAKIAGKKVVHKSAEAAGDMIGNKIADRIIVNNGELIEDVDDLDVVMPMYNLLEYSKNYRKTIGSLYNYYRDELTNDNIPAGNTFDNVRVVNSSPFKYKNKIIGNTYNVDAADEGYDANKEGTQKIELAIPLKYLGNFWRALNIPLVSCEVSLELKWNKNCIITSLQKRVIEAARPSRVDNAPTGATLNITDCKLYIPVVTLSKDDEIKLLTNLKSGFTREIRWNKQNNTK